MRTKAAVGLSLVLTIATVGPLTASPRRDAPTSASESPSFLAFQMIRIIADVGLPQDAIKLKGYISLHWRQTWGPESAQRNETEPTMTYVLNVLTTPTNVSACENYTYATYIHNNFHCPRRRVSEIRP